MQKISFLMVLFLSACVTINIYFPAAAVDKVADEIIKEIQEGSPDSTQQIPASQTHLFTWEIKTYQLIDRAIAILISSAHAEPNLAVDTVEIRRLKASMRTRFADLKVLYNQGLIGITTEGLLTNKTSIPLKDRNKVNKLIQAENTDRKHLYQSIANANGRPEWFTQIKAAFAKMWVNNAQSGWWYQDGNQQWQQK